MKLRWTGNNLEELLKFCGPDVEVKCRFGTQDYKVSIKTKYGDQRVYKNDDIIKSDVGGFSVRHNGDGGD